ncbi:protein of unknown function [Pectobacterium carotovorum]|nr:protein of unknown function [Pectobacterium carotovorum]
MFLFGLGFLYICHSTICRFAARSTKHEARSTKHEEKLYTLGDGLGLSLLIEPSGSKSWRFRYRFGDKPKMISFGSYPLVSLAEARKKRDKTRKKVLDGINPSEHRKAQKLNLMSESDNTFEIIVRE